MSFEIENRYGQKVCNGDPCDDMRDVVVELLPYLTTKSATTAAIDFIEGIKNRYLVPAELDKKYKAAIEVSKHIDGHIANIMEPLGETTVYFCDGKTEDGICPKLLIDPNNFEVIPTE